jgi:uncharacterized protein (DUF2147 family)
MRVLKFIAPAAVILSLAPALSESSFAGSDPTGIWLNDTGRGAVEIKTCGNALCGNVVWVKSSSDADGCGKQIIGGVTPVGGGRWDNGWIYSPERGRKYDVELTPLANGNLKVVGYAGMKFLSKTMIWKPAPADLQLCTGTQAAKPPVTKVATATPAAPANAPEQDATAKNNSPSPVPAKPEEKAKEAAAPAVSPDQRKTAPDETAKADGDAPADEDNGPAGDLGKLKIGDLQLDKVLTKTKDGKCKLDLPWIKVSIDCEH